MAWVSVSLNLGLSVPGSVDSTQAFPVGMVAQFRDPTYGVGEFIYLPGVASTAAGDVVNYSVSDGATNTGSTTRWAGTAGTGIPLAIATAATVASTWGWYQISGAAVVNTSGTVAAGDKAFYQATATVSSTQVNGKQVQGMTAASANGVPSANKAIYTINRPSAQDQVV